MHQLLAIFIASLLIHSSAAIAGSSNASLDCTATNKNSSGLKLSGSIPGDELWFELKLSSKKGETVFSSSKDERIAVVTGFKKAVFTMSVMREDSQELILYAIPASVKAQGGDSREVKASFDAILLQAPKPGYTGEMSYDSYIRNAPMRCSFTHSV